MALDADVVVVGGGLAGLVAAAEIADAGKRVIVVDQEGDQNLGGQAFWSFGGLFFVDSPEQRRLRIQDSLDLAMQDWFGNAGFDRDDDAWPRRWAEAYVAFAATEKRSWLASQGMKWFPVVGWAERGGGSAWGPGNSVPRFHITWGTGPGVIEPFVRRAREHAAAGRLVFKFRHRVTRLVVKNRVVEGVAGDVLELTAVERGQRSSRTVVGSFELKAQAVVIASGGIGGNHDLVRQAWPKRLGAPPKKLLSGVPAHVDGLMLGIAERAGGRFINGDRMWHYVEGVANWEPIWPMHAIRILPGPSSFWFDAFGKRLPPPLYPGFDTLGSLDHIMKSGREYTWFIANKRIVGKEFALSGSEQNPDLTGKSWRDVIGRATQGISKPVQAFLDKGEDFLVDANFENLVARMNALAGEALLDAADIRRQIEARDREVDNAFTKDMQITMIRGHRNFLGDKLIRTAPPHRLLDPAAGPLVAVKLNLMTRKSLGGLETDLDARVLKVGGEPFAGLYAAGEASGFGGGGVHGYRSLEGTFLGGCIFSGRTAGRAVAKAV